MNNLKDTPEIDVSNLPAVIPDGAVGSALEAQEIDVPEKVTAAQAKVDSIAQLTMAAYQKAATLALTPQESDALQEPFPDEAFQPGAGGKANLIYIEHAFLRDRLNRVLGIGQWSLIPRNRWAEPFKFYSKTDKCQKDGTRIYVEAMLLVRGCFVSEAVGAMEYYPNDATNYGDAVEGAKTAALRRCCKEFGIGLQAWSKDWCDGWWQRRNQGARRPAPATAPPARTGPPPSQPAKSAATIPPARPAETPEQRKARWITLMRDAAGNQDEYAIAVLVDHDILLPTELLEDFPIEKLPTSQGVAKGLLDEIRARSGAGTPPPATKPAANVGGTEAWRSFPMPFGKNAGTPLGNLAKNYLFGLWVNFKVETEYQGRPRPRAKIDADTKLRQMLDEAGKHYQFIVRSEVDEPQDSCQEDAPPGREASQADTEDDDVPF